MNHLSLTQSQIESTNLFFSQVDTTNSGKVTIRQLKLACSNSNSQENIYDHTTSLTQSWVYELMYSKGLGVNSSLTYNELLEYTNDFPQLGSIDQLYNQLKRDPQSEPILFNELCENFKTEPEKIIIKSSGESWLDTLKENENLTDDSELTLVELLEFEEKYNTTRYWPIAQ